MACVAPYVVRHPDGLIDRVRCGRCHPCRIRRKQSWVGRLLLEAADFSHVRFLTLTYEEDPGELSVRDLQLFLKRFRVSFGQARYFAVGEYGEVSGRGHWHLITYGPCLELGGHTLSRVWKAGFSTVGDVRRGAIGYVAGYALKQSPVRFPRIVRMSLRPGIGFPRIGFIAQQAARTGLLYWPSRFCLGGKWYPLCDGGRRHFISCYLNAGGRPPAELTPEERDVVARLQIADWGSRRSEDRARTLSEVMQGADRYATSQARFKRSTR